MRRLSAEREPKETEKVVHAALVTKLSLPAHIINYIKAQGPLWHRASTGFSIVWEVETPYQI